jgi:hypothetical protein
MQRVSERPLWKRLPKHMCPSWRDDVISLRCRRVWIRRTTNTTMFTNWKFEIYTSCSCGLIVKRIIGRCFTIASCGMLTSHRPIICTVQGGKGLALAHHDRFLKRLIIYGVMSRWRIFHYYTSTVTVICDTIKIPPCSKALSAELRSKYRQWWRLHIRGKKIFSGTRNIQ